MKIIKKYKQLIENIVKTNIQINVLTNDGWVELIENHLCYIKNKEGGIYIEFRINNKKLISRFKLVEFPGCCGICISTGVEVFQDYRNMGINIILNNFRIDIAKYLGFGLLLCTDISKNLHEVKTLNKNNWKHIYNFKNPRTLNNINISIKEL